ncbi:MAG: SPFH domain-containing protein [Peptococcaceae bacterium]|nr:SPFH domain-containing protein [Peptococcaceae bacterium]
MGLIKAAMGAAGGAMADQWKRYFYCDAIDVNVLAVKGRKREDARSSNTKGTENIIASGSIVAVADGQAMVIVDQGKIVEFCAEPGEFVYDASTEPSIFNGKLGSSIRKTFAAIGKRFQFGGQPAKDQRIYYFNLKEIVGNKYGTPSPVPFRVVDQNIGLDVDIAIRCNGEYSYRLTDPLLFYANVCGNIDFEYRRDQIDSMLKSELLTALQPAFAKISAIGVRYSALPGHTHEMADALNEVLSQKWAGLRGLAIASFGINSVTASPEDEKMIKELQRTSVMRNAGMAGATLVTAQADAMKTAAGNPNGAIMGFLGMNAAMGAGSNAGTFYSMDAQQQQQQQQQQQFGQQQPQFGQQQFQQQPQQQPPHQTGQPGRSQSPGEWTCACGAVNSGKFCIECGKTQPQPAEGMWRCACGTESKGKFCNECGKPKPDGSWICGCGVTNKGKFCSECGKQKT